MLNIGINLKKRKSSILLIFRIPYESCRILASRCCYSLRYELVPLFGPDFPEDCIHPSQPAYGKLVLNDQRSSHLVNAKRKKHAITSGSPNTPHDESEELHCDKNGDNLQKGSIFQNLRSDHLEEYSKSPKRWKPNSPRGMELLLNYEDITLSPTLRSHPRSRSTYSQRRLSQSVTPTQSPLCSPMTLAKTCSPTPSTSTIATGWGDSQDCNDDSRSHKSPVTLIPSGQLTYATSNPCVNLSNDLIDTITATILLQRLSQDDGCRPFRPWQETKLPRTINVAGREFSVVWME